VPRAGLSSQRVVEEAELLADETGSPAVSLAVLAARLGVRVPSLYKHVAGSDALQRLISIRAKSELADVLGRATVGMARDEAVGALSRAYRDWATAHPGRYAATLRAPKSDDADDVDASERAIRVIFDALAGYGLVGEDAIDATRLLRASLHGFISLDAAGGFGLPHVDRTFARLVASAQLMLTEWRPVTI
jgi:AcrR family transcriptional regulator